MPSVSPTTVNTRRPIADLGPHGQARFAAHEHLVPAPDDRATSDDRGRHAERAQPIADELDAERLGPDPELERLEHDGAGLTDAGDGADDPIQVVGHPRGLREGAVGVLLHHPEIRAGGLHDAERFDDQSAVDPAHRHDGGHEQPEPERGQQEPTEAIPDIPDRQVHGARGRRPARPRSRDRRAAPGATTTSSPGRRPLSTSIQPEGSAAPKPARLNWRRPSVTTSAPSPSGRRTTAESGRAATLGWTGGRIVASTCSPSVRRPGRSSRLRSTASCSVTRSPSRWMRATRRGRRGGAASGRRRPRDARAPTPPCLARPRTR